MATVKQLVVVEPTEENADVAVAMVDHTLDQFRLPPRSRPPTLTSNPTTNASIRRQQHRITRPCSPNPLLQQSTSASLTVQKTLRTGTLKALNPRRMNFTTLLNHFLITSPRTRTRRSLSDQYRPQLSADVLGDVVVAAPGGTKREIGMWKRLVRPVVLDSLVLANMSVGLAGLRAANGAVLPVVRGLEQPVVGEDVVLPRLLWVVYTSRLRMFADGIEQADA